MAEYPQMIAGGYVLPPEKKKKKKSTNPSMIGAGYVTPQDQTPPQTSSAVVGVPQRPSAEITPPMAGAFPPLDLSMGGPGYAPGAGFPRQMGAPEAFPTIANDQGMPGGGTWFDMFSSAPQLTAQTPQLPQVGGGQAQVQPAPMDPLSAFMTSQMGKQQPVIPPFDAAGLVKALRYDPVSEHSRLASLPSYAPESQSPFATGYFKQPSSAGLSPEAVLASQGNTATNQWAQMGGVPSLDPELLRRLNAGVAGRRLY